MRPESIFDTVKVDDIKISLDDYVRLSLSGKSEYVSALIRSFRENLTHHGEVLENHFKKYPIRLEELELVEQEFSLWMELVFQTLYPFILGEHFTDCYFEGASMDELIIEYDTDDMRDKEIPKDALLDYVGRIREFLTAPPLRASILKKLKTSPQTVLNYSEDETDEAEETNEDETPESYSEGIIMVAGERLEITYPFYSVAKYLEKKKAFSEEKAISQNQIHEDLKLRFKEPRLKQWKKIKGKTNPVISKIFHTNSRGLVWLKKNVKPI